MDADFGSPQQEVLYILLQHDCARTQMRLAARLLCCSKDVAAAVAEHCAGCLSLNDPRAARLAGQGHVAAWLRKHAPLLGSLDLEGGVRLAGGRPLSDAVLAAGPRKLRLRSLKIAATDVLAVSLMEKMVARHLTYLRVHVVTATPGLNIQHHTSRFSRALARLKSLKSLDVLSDLWIRHPLTHLRGMSALRQLTRVEFMGPSILALPHLPPSLVELTNYYEERQSREPVDLSLPNCTSLVMYEPNRLNLLPEDVLPPNLATLHISEAGCIEPVLALSTQLRDLQLSFPNRARLDFTAEQLSAWPNLTSLDLSYTCLGDELSDGWEEEEFYPEHRVPAGIAAWPLLPLKCLQLHWLKLSPAACEALGRATGLTSLALCSCWLSSPAIDLASAVDQLTALQQVVLQDVEVVIELVPKRRQDRHGFWYDDYDDCEEQDCSMDELLDSVSELEQLQRLKLYKVCDYGPSGSLVQLQSATALTELSVVECGDNVGHWVPYVIPKLLGLRKLECVAADAALAVIGQLPQLTELSVPAARYAAHDAAVTDAGLSHLSGLHKLQVLQLGAGTGVTQAGLAALTQLSCLRRVSGVPQPGRDWLQQQMPHLQCW